MKKIKKDIVIVAVLCITILEVAALIAGIDGQLFTLIIAVIAGLAGLVMPQPSIISKK